MPTKEKEELERLKRMNRNLEGRNLGTDEVKRRIAKIKVIDNRNTPRDIVRGEHTPVRKQLESMAWDLGQGELEAGRSRAMQLERKPTSLVNKDFNKSATEINKRLDARAMSDNKTIAPASPRPAGILTSSKDTPVPESRPNRIEMDSWEDTNSDTREKLIRLGKKAIKEGNVNLPERLEETYESEFKPDERPLPWRDPMRKYDSEGKIDVDSYGTPIYDRSGLSPRERRGSGLGLASKPRKLKVNEVKLKPVSVPTGEFVISSPRERVTPKLLASSSGDYSHPVFHVNEKTSVLYDRQERFINTHTNKSLSYARGGVFAAGAAAAGIGRYMAGEGEGEKAAGTGTGLAVGLIGAGVVGSNIAEEINSNKKQLFNTLSDLDKRPYVAPDIGEGDEYLGKVIKNNVRTERYQNTIAYKDRYTQRPVINLVSQNDNVPTTFLDEDVRVAPRTKIDITRQTAKREAMRAFHEANSASLYKGKNAAMLAATALLATGAGLAFNTADKSSGLNSKRGNRI